MNRWILSTSLAALAGGLETPHRAPHSAATEARVVQLQHRKATWVASALELVLRSRREFEELGRDLVLDVQPDNGTNSLVLSSPDSIPEWVVSSIHGLDRERKRVTLRIPLKHAQAADVEQSCVVAWAVKSTAFLVRTSRWACAMPNYLTGTDPFEWRTFSEVIEDLPRFEVDPDSNSMLVSGFDSRQLNAASDWIADRDEDAAKPR